VKKHDKFLGRSSAKDPKAYLKQRLLRHEFMLRRARKNNADADVIRLIHAVTRELRYIYRDLFTGENDEEGKHKIEL
jgi:hypothetical protein